jgi:hypothetical protein
MPLPNGEIFDASKVNVAYTTGGSTQNMGAVPSEADCANVQSAAWYYDDPTNPTKVKVCSNTCTAIQSLTDVRVDVVFGCQTEILIK